jgi:hypothetical protein
MSCRHCGHEFEAIAKIDEEVLGCQKCKDGIAIRIPSVRGPNCVNEDSGWLKSVLQVVEKDSPKLHVQAFLKDPTRSNYRAWMRGEGLRPYETGEKAEKFKFDADRHAEKVMQEKIKRERYAVRG